MKAVLGDTVIAEAPKEDLISIEGNWYFPPVERQRGVPAEEQHPVHLPVEGRMPVLLREGWRRTASGPGVELPDPLPDRVRPRR